MDKGDFMKTRYFYNQERKIIWKTQGDEVGCMQLNPRSGWFYANRTSEEDLYKSECLVEIQEYEAALLL